MPAKKKRHVYSVIATWYATEQDRNWEQEMFVPAFRGELVYVDGSERLAAWHFARACQAQMHDPLAYSVTMKRGAEVIAQVKPLSL
jgi:hypothetical protein